MALEHLLSVVYPWRTKKPNGIVSHSTQPFTSSIPWVAYARKVGRKLHRNFLWICIPFRQMMDDVFLLLYFAFSIIYSYFRLLPLCPIFHCLSPMIYIVLYCSPLLLFVLANAWQSIHKLDNREMELIEYLRFIRILNKIIFVPCFGVLSFSLRLLAQKLCVNVRATVCWISIIVNLKLFSRLHRRCLVRFPFTFLLSLAMTASLRYPFDAATVCRESGGATIRQQFVYSFHQARNHDMNNVYWRWEYIGKHLIYFDRTQSAVFHWIQYFGLRTHEKRQLKMDCDLVWISRQFRSPMMYTNHHRFVTDTQ